MAKNQETYSPAILDPKCGIVVKRYIKCLKKEFNTAETYVLLSKLRHQLPKQAPTWMWKSSFTLADNFVKSVLLRDFEEGLASGGNFLSEVPDYVSFITSQEELVTFFRRRLRPPYLRNVMLHLEGPPENGTYHFSFEDLLSWTGLMVSNNGPMSGCFPSSLETLFLRPLNLDDGTDYAKLLNGLLNLKILIINECALLDRLPPLQETFPALEALVCLEYLDPCHCYNKVESFLPYGMGILAGRKRECHLITWHGHIFYSSMDVLSRVCDVELPKDFQLSMDMCNLRAARKRKRSSDSV